MSELAVSTQQNVFVQFLKLTKPRVNALIVFTAMIGMMLAYPVGIAWDLPLMLTATIGIALVAGAAAAFNCLVEQQIDKKMARTRARRRLGLENRNERPLLIGVSICVAIAQIANTTPTTKNLLAMKVMMMNEMNIR